MFAYFDANGNGELDFFEFTLANNATSLDTPEDKLEWIFTVFDKERHPYRIVCHSAKSMLFGMRHNLDTSQASDDFAILVI